MPVNSETSSDEIVRVAAKGDGVTADGRHIAFSAPGDVIQSNGGLVKGPHHIDPACQHFRQCGGCSLQHLDQSSYLQFVEDRVVHALAGQGIEPSHVCPPSVSPPKSRIRASLRAAKIGQDLKLGFSGSGSHRIIDLEQCEILDPQLFSIIAPLRRYLSKVAPRKHDINIDMTLVDQGVDLIVKNYLPEGLEAFESLSQFARQLELARLSIDSGYGPETQWEPEPVTVTFDGISVAFPHSGFLQATNHGQALLVKKMVECIGNSKLIADLFSGLGTFALNCGTDRKVYAAEASRDAITALQTAANSSGRPVFTEHRDLFRRPLDKNELNRFDAVILDPPRAGAREQVAQLAQSDVGKVCYISCNPASFARDAKTLVTGGYELEDVSPVGQFLWSTHVELVASFSKI